MSNKMPALFLAHGSPMNAIEKNDYTEMLSALGKSISKPKAILCISAHWTTKGTWITHMKNPRMIYDFYGFPEELSKVVYPAPGSPEFAEKISSEILNPTINKDDSEWGFDHGTWSVLNHLFPEADIPVMQLSLDMTQPAEFHFHLGEQFKKFREQGLLIIGSGNIVHNLRIIDWDTNAKPLDWSVEFDEWVKTKIESRDYNSLIHDPTKTKSGKMSIPTWEHYLPLLYILGASDKNEKPEFIYSGFQNASISMRSVAFYST